MATSPTQQSLKYLRKSGCELVAVTEKWNPHAHVRQDLFGIIDVLAINGKDVIAVQACAMCDVSKRVLKMADSDALPHILKAGIKVFIHGWKKNVKTNRYDLREVELS